MTKKVLIFSTAYYPNYIGGAEVAIKEITDRINTDEIRFFMITPRMDRSLSSVESIGNVEIHRVGFGINKEIDKLLSPFLGAVKAISISNREGIDIFWCMMASFTSGAAYIVNILRFWDKIPIVLTLQEGDSDEYIERKRRFGIVGLSWKLSLPRSSIVTVISSHLGDRAKYFGYKDEPVLIPNGFSSSKFSEEGNIDEIEELKKKLGKKEGDIYLVTVGRLVHKNANDDVIRAIPMMPENVHVLIVGGGPDEEMLKNLAKELDVENRVRFMGQVDREWTAKYRKVSDIFSRPSRSEGMGNSFVSAMVSRLPVIATQEGGIRDFLFDAKRNPDKETTGWAVDKDSPEQIAEAVKDIIANPDQVRKVTGTAYNMAVNNYNWNNIARDMRDKVFGSSFLK